MLFELGVEIGISKTALRPVLSDDDVTIARTEIRMKLSAPGSGGKALHRVAF